VAVVISCTSLWWVGRAFPHLSSAEREPNPVARGYDAGVLQVVAVLQVLLSIALIGLILMHSGRDSGFGGMGFTPASQGGTHIVERNLTRVTVVVAVLFFTNTIILFRLLS
jgi:preprotein translocase subunit SecG